MFCDVRYWAVAPTSLWCCILHFCRNWRMPKLRCISAMLHLCKRRNLATVCARRWWKIEMARPTVRVSEILALQLAVQIIYNCQSATAILFPRESETRSIKDLSGKWRFQIDVSPSRQQSFEEKWWTDNLPGWIDMPVPASYNDITQNITIRDFVGWAW